MVDSEGRTETTVTRQEADGSPRDGERPSYKSLGKGPVAPPLRSHIPLVASATQCVCVCRFFFLRPGVTSSSGPGG